MNKSTSGFTIVELLIVIVVIAILAAISVVAYTGVQNKANDTAVQADLRNFENKLEVYRVEQGAYPVSAADMNAAMVGFSATHGAYDTSYYNFTYRTAVDRGVYVIAARSKSGKIWFRSSTESGVDRISSTYAGTVGSLIGISEPASEPVGSHYGYRLNTDSWADWTN